MGNTTVAVVFTFMPEAVVVEKKEKGIVRWTGKQNWKEGWKEIRKMDGNRD